MTRHYFSISALILLLLITGSLRAVYSQTRPYAKYGSSGETIGMFNLMKNPIPCDTWYVFTGTITSVRSQKRNKEVEYRLIVRTVERLRTFAFSIGVDEIPRTDIVNLVTTNRGVKLRACETTGPWLAVEITRTGIR